MSEPWDFATLAAMEYEPWNPADCMVPTTQEYIEGAHDALMIVRLGFAICCRTKEENVTAAEKLGGQEAVDAIGELDRIANFYKALAGIADAAHARMLVAMGVLAVKEGQSA